MNLIFPYNTIKTKNEWVWMGGDGDQCGAGYGTQKLAGKCFITELNLQSKEEGFLVFSFSSFLHCWELNLQLHICQTSPTQCLPWHCVLHWTASSTELHPQVHTCKAMLLSVTLKHGMLLLHFLVHTHTHLRYSIFDNNLCSLKT